MKEWNADSVGDPERLERSFVGHYTIADGGQLVGRYAIRTHRPAPERHPERK